MAQVEHITLTASTAASVTVTAPADGTSTFNGIYGDEVHTVHNYLGSVMIVNHSSTETVYYRFDGTNPTEAGAANDFVLPPSSSFVHSPVRWDSKQFVLISAGTPTVSIVGE